MGGYPTALMLHDVLARVEARLEVVGLNATAASRAAGLSGDAIRNLRRAATGPDKRQGVSTRTIAALAPVLKTSVGWLLNGEGDEAAIDEPFGAPLISWVSAGNLQSPETVSELEDAPKAYAHGLDPNGEWIALRVDGRSMDLISPPESVIFVNTRDKRLVPNGLYVIADDNGEASYKRYRPGPPVRFEPVTSQVAEYESLFPDAGNMPTIVGRVRKTMLEM